MIGRHRPEVLRKSAAGTNRAARLLIVTLAASGLLPSASDAARFRRSITFEERVRAQEAIERVYYSHQTGAARRFEDLVPRALIEKKVQTYLKQSLALERIWNAPLSPEMLRQEVKRIAAQTRMPERLRELY